MYIKYNTLLDLACNFCMNSRHLVNVRVGLRSGYFARGPATSAKWLRWLSVLHAFVDIACNPKYSQYQIERLSQVSPAFTDNKQIVFPYGQVSILCCLIGASMFIVWIVNIYVFFRSISSGERKQGEMVSV